MIRTHGVTAGCRQAIPVRGGGLAVLLGLQVLVLVFALSVLRHVWSPSITIPRLLNGWLSVFTGLVIQSIPFLVGGVAISAAIAAFLPADLLGRIMPKHPLAAVPVAGACGVLLPGCECASVPVTDSLIRRGLSPAAAFTFLLAAPAVNPIVIASTAVAFPHIPMMPWARLAASFVAACIMGWLWAGVSKRGWLRPDALDQHHHHGTRWDAFRTSMVHDFVYAGGYLVLGAMIAAFVNVFIPGSWLAAVGNNVVVGVLAMAVGAVIIAVCSEADAFVAASLTAFSPTAQLAFMVVSPMVDVKLIAMQRGAFGRGFVWRFAPTTFVVAVLAAIGIGAVLL